VPTAEEYDLARFVEAHDSHYARVRSELQQGQKRSHWMWFVFPQIQGLGSSEMSLRYAIRDIGEAKAYLADPTLGQRLRECVSLLLVHKDKTCESILGPIDSLKLQSCLTLFLEAAHGPGDIKLFSKALEQFHFGRRDEATLRILSETSTS